MLEDEGEKKGDVEREEASSSQRSASFPPVYHPTPAATAHGEGRVPLGVRGVSRKADHRQRPFNSGFGCSLCEIRIVTAGQGYSVHRVESKGSCLENVGTSVRRKMLICA